MKISNEEIDELKIISDYLNINNEEIQKLGYSLYVSKYQDKLNEYISDIKIYNSKRWFGKHIEYACTFRHYPRYEHQFSCINLLSEAIIKLINDIKWEQTFI